LKKFQYIEVVELYTSNNDVLDRALFQTCLEKDKDPRYTLIMKTIKKGVSGDQTLRVGVNLFNNEEWHITKSDIY
jgi:hypothetical protein